MTSVRRPARAVVFVPLREPPGCHATVKRRDIHARPRLVRVSVGPCDDVRHAFPIWRHLRVYDGAQEIEIFWSDSSFRSWRHHVPPRVREFSSLDLVSPKMDGKPLQSAESRHSSPLQRRFREANSREPPHQRSNGDLTLRAGKRRSEAVMHTSAEGMMVRLLARYVEPVRLRIHRRV